MKKLEIKQIEEFDVGKVDPQIQEGEPNTKMVDSNEIGDDFT